ncbi:recombinase family protein [Actinoplanes sp. KI2]|uniref:recombinase family protein n=1 Tax=Actinoplanes sp. KI2 TaxID=2983315 RepID=UPI0021D5E2AF|nr:recombinase family protein [Actinoplanes sp. KI2]MCU7731196.1 recombinase family protein [Actinoplanes sp. KI2]
MPSLARPTALSSFDSWIEVPQTVRRRGRSVIGPGRGGLRFAFYGRISTVEYQDPVSSRAWQVEAAGRVVAGRGRIVVEFFDAGASRSLPWARRPQAAALLAAAEDPDRGFDAVVVGEFERAFAGGEAQLVIALLASFGVAVWLPEARGPVDLARAEHQALLLMLGHQAEREVLRNRFRTSAAMAAQVKEQGRNLGGRPPYGYRLVDAGPHPKVMHAAWGRRRHRLEVDPVTAGIVQWMFASRLDGLSAAGIARLLNERGVASPGVYDHARNRHRSGAVWTLRTVAAILANPRYTGRQVWNRQFTDHREAVPGDKRSSRGPVRVWNPRSDWVISNEATHDALVSDADFLAVQQVTALAMPEDGRVHRYQLTGLLVCESCGRRLEGHWVNRRPGYRCRTGTPAPVRLRRTGRAGCTGRRPASSRRSSPAARAS